MQNDGDTLTPEPPVHGRQTRQDRQARVGILRNPNGPPRPPIRRAMLMGRWPSLRSSRRPRTAAVEEAAHAVVAQLDPAAGDRTTPLPVRRAADGSVQAIDVAGLMASVEEMGTGGRIRTPFGATMRADGSAPEPPPAAPRKAWILTAEAWIDDTDDPDEDDDALGAAFRDGAATIAPPPGRRRRGLWIVVLGTLVALAILVVLPAWGILQPA